VCGWFRDFVTGFKLPASTAEELTLRHAVWVAELGAEQHAYARGCILRCVQHRGAAAVAFHNNGLLLKRTTAHQRRTPRPWHLPVRHSVVSRGCCASARLQTLYLYIYLRSRHHCCRCLSRVHHCLLHDAVVNRWLRLFDWNLLYCGGLFCPTCYVSSSPVYLPRLCLPSLRFAVERAYMVLPAGRLLRVLCLAGGTPAYYLPASVPVLHLPRRRSAVRTAFDILALQPVHAMPRDACCSAGTRILFAALVLYRLYFAAAAWRVPSCRVRFLCYCGRLPAPATPEL